MATWTPSLALDSSLVPAAQKFIDRMPPAHLEAPADGERFEVPEEAMERLQDYAFSQGFVVANPPPPPPPCDPTPPPAITEPKREVKKTKKWEQAS